MTEEKLEELKQKFGLDGSEIAIVGMACRFPDADTTEEFWANLSAGRESLSRISGEDLRRGGLDPNAADDPRYVPFVPVLGDIESFDAGFFGYTDLEAKLMDPQQRLFLECAWEAFEDAGYFPEDQKRTIGVFTGAKTNTYLFNLFSNREFFGKQDLFQVALGNDLACMATRVSYKLGLQGPSYALHTACSTSLVSVHLACQSLLLGECEMALAGGAAINVPQRRGYLYQKGGILSPDGHCRTFDQEAQGSNFGNGVGAVVLKRWEDAVADGDNIYALIKGSAVNNDGAHKASFTAPGVEGQTRVLLDAMAAAGVDADSISYIEAHGTATDLGDSIEMLALTNAFRATSRQKRFCAIGSVKTNIGHLETAAGIAGLIKTALALHHQRIPPSLHFRRPNSKIDFENSPFYVNTQLAEWKTDRGPRRAGVSSFGIGSTNAHVVMQESPQPEPSGASRPVQLLVYSARSENALDHLHRRLLGRLKQTVEAPDRYLADVAYTLKSGRKRFPFRRAVVCSGLPDAITAMEEQNPAKVFTYAGKIYDRPVIFLFPGLGDHYPGMGADLYRSETTFRKYVDQGAEQLRRHLNLDVRDVLFAATREDQDGRIDFRRMVGRQRGRDEATEQLNQTHIAQPAAFIVEYALARLWMEWGIVPQAMIGYSLGEYVAACLAGVLSLEDAITLVARRALLIQELPAGAMLAVPMSRQQVAPLMTKYGLSLGAVNGPALCVLSGPVEAIEHLEKELGENQVICRRLQTTHAFHSRAMDILAEPLTEIVRSMQLHPPRIPFISNVTGTWIRDEEALDPGHWARHMTEPVLFDSGIAELIQGQEKILLEVGPGQGLTSFIKQHPACPAELAQLTLPSLPSAYDRRRDSELMQETLGRMWLSGRAIDWKSFYAGEARRRVPLPTYPFERRRYWVDPPEAQSDDSPQIVTAGKKEMAEWFYVPVWRAAVGKKRETETPKSHWLIFSDRDFLGARLARQLRNAGHSVTCVFAGEAFAKHDDGEFTIHPGSQGDYLTLLAAVAKQGVIENIAHLWTLTRAEDAESESGFSQLSQQNGFYSLMFLAQALGRQPPKGTVSIEIVANRMQKVTGQDIISPAKATVLGPVRVIPQEFPNLSCRSIDIVCTSDEPAEAADGLAAQLIAEFGNAPESAVALRDGVRYEESYEARKLVKEEQRRPRLREKGVYFITGGLGGLGLTLGEHLAKTVQARLVLLGRSPLRRRDQGPGDENEKVRAIRRMEEAGGEVLTLSADAADEAAMRKAMEQALQRFGVIHGVIHLAGVPGGGIIQLKTREVAEQVMAPKMMGALLLEKLFAERDLDFMALYSSIASVLGEFGQADYCAAGAFLDAFAKKNAGGGKWPTVSINWEIWREVGIGVNTQVPEHLRELRQQMLNNGIPPAEGVRAFEEVLACGLNQVIVCPQDLAERIRIGKSLTAGAFLKQMEKTRLASPPRQRAVMGTGFAGAGSGVEQTIAAVWQRILGREQIGVHDNFFDLGGNSLLGLQLVTELSQELGMQIAPVTLFEFPTVRLLTRHLNPEAVQVSEEALEIADRRTRSRAGARSEIAIIGMAGRFPGAANVEELWQNLCAGKETVSFFTDEELLAAGVDPAMLRNPRYVKAASVLEDVDHFDAGLFGYAPREAEIMDPQHRIFLECAWEVLERAGCNPHSYPGRIGVFAGSNLSTYLLKLYSDPRVRNSVNHLQALIGNDKDSLTTTVSYKLNLRGPSVAVQTFCSTSLVAVHMACQSLRQGDCDMALAGGVRVVVPHRHGYMYEQGGIWPADGHTRSFDAKANGSPFGNGVGIVCLKRLEDALADGDPIDAVIRGTAINNDGAGKAGYTAPSVAGQSAVIEEALADAGVDPETIGYVEAHGSATELGDPIEVSALSRAFAAHTEKKKFCAIGSVKSNFGHLDRAAGVTALIKTALSLRHRQIPPSINFEQPNPNIDFENSPFFVNSTLREWSGNGTPRRAGVNSLGVGGTNVHIVVEEAPAIGPSAPSRPWQLLMISGKSEAVLDQIGNRLAAHLAAHPQVSLADVAWTLQVGRKPLEYRRIAVCRDSEDAQKALAEAGSGSAVTAYREDAERRVVFMFPGMGAHYVGMARGLYDSEPTFKETLDWCAERLVQYLDFDLRKDLYPEGEAPAAREEAPVDLRRMLKRGSDLPASDRLDRTEVSQPLLFAVEYALAKLWMEWGIRPHAMIGYSLGEYVAACLANVMSPEDALKLVAGRARLIQGLAPGALLAVALPSERIGEVLGDGLSLMAINGPGQSVVSGPVEKIDELESRLAREAVSCRRLEASHAFHSAMMKPIFEQVRELAASIRLGPPETPYVSNVTGTWITPEQATDPAYWARHMCEPVRFSQGTDEVLAIPGVVLLEIGPPLLSSIVLQAREAEKDPAVLSCLRHSYETRPDLSQALMTLGKLWLLGVDPDWKGFCLREKRRRTLLPAYPFQRRRYWIETRSEEQQLAGRIAGDRSRGPEWFYSPSWKRVQDLSSRRWRLSADQGKWWVLTDAIGVGREIARRLENKGLGVVCEAAGGSDDCARIINTMLEGGLPQGILYLWGLTAPNAGDQTETSGAGLAAIGEILGRLETAREIPLWIVSNGLHTVTGDEELLPAKSALSGLALAFSRQVPALKVRSIDPGPAFSIEKTARQVIAEINADSPECTVAYRARGRWIPTLAVATPEVAEPSLLKDQGVYLLVDALGAIGGRFAEFLGRKFHARLALAEPEGFPERKLWDEWLAADHGGSAIATKIHRIRQLEAETDVLTINAALTDGAQAQAVVRQIAEHFGGLDGVLWFFDGPSARGETPETRSRALSALDNAMGQCSPDFRLLISPLPSAGASAEESALLFSLDHFATLSARDDSRRWTSVTWLMPDESDDGHHETLEKLFQMEFTGNLVVSPAPLQDGWNRLKAALSDVPSEVVAPPVSSYPRPALRVAYAPPSTTTEETIAQLWRDLLGVKEIGIHDNFLELGGDSLMATRLISRMKDTFNRELPVRLIFEASTIEELARAVDERQPDGMDAQDEEELMQMLDQLSEEEVEQELMRRKQMETEV